MSQFPLPLIAAGNTTGNGGAPGTVIQGGLGCVMTVNAVGVVFVDIDSPNNDVTTPDILISVSQGFGALLEDVYWAITSPTPGRLVIETFGSDDAPIDSPVHFFVYLKPKVL